MNSRRKGKRGEQEVAQLLRVWWSKIEPVEFVSTPGSGGWASAKLRAEFKASGDIATTAKRFPFTVEVKREQNWSMGTFVAGRKSPVWGWWRQAIGEALEQRAVPMLWFRKNRQPWFVLLPHDYVVQRISTVQMDIVWANGLPKADYGEVLPYGMLAAKLLGIDPAKFAK